MSKLQLRFQMEQLLVTAFLVEVFKKNLCVRIDNGEEQSPVLGTLNLTPEEFAAVVWKKYCNQTDEERLFVYDNMGSKQLGWIYVVYGNDGWDAVSDYTAKPLIEELMKPVNELSDALEAGKFKIVPQ